MQNDILLVIHDFGRRCIWRPIRLEGKKIVKRKGIKNNLGNTEIRSIVDCCETMYIMEAHLSTIACIRFRFDFVYNTYANTIWC